MNQLHLENISHLTHLLLENNGTKISLRMTRKHRPFEESYTCNPSTCACEWDKDFETGEYLKDCKCMKSLADGLAATCDEIADTPQITFCGHHH